MNNTETKSELNKELLDAISLNVDVDWDDDYGEPKAFYSKCADECEMICLEREIELLDKIEKDLMNRFLTKSARDINHTKQKLQEQLNKLK